VKGGRSGHPDEYKGREVPTKKKEATQIKKETSSASHMPPEKKKDYSTDIDTKLVSSSKMSGSIEPCLGPLVAMQ